MWKNTFLYLVDSFCNIKYVDRKSLFEVERYVWKWHQMFQLQISSSNFNWKIRNIWKGEGTLAVKMEIFITFRWEIHFNMPKKTKIWNSILIFKSLLHLTQFIRPTSFFPFSPHAIFQNKFSLHETNFLFQENLQK